jgi:DNA helicase-2/ATP-dependent DNA helicase PcrA
MEKIKTKVFVEEEKRCNYTVNYAKKTLTSYIINKENLDSQLDSTFKRLSSDSSQDYTDILAKVGIQKNLDVKIKDLQKATLKPYFAKIDFKEKTKVKMEHHYIGKMSLMREEDQEVIIVDWRAPIANLYYEERLGETSYECPDGIINGDLTLKRQLIINEGRLESVFDIDITTNDEFLQSHLGANSNDRLKEIVSTIQAEQNRIIRADMWKPLIVQGAAGSGKTTIALHRIAYLIYTYEKRFDPENFMILAPSNLFLNYISEILPDLGVEKVEQTTFEEISMRLLRKKFKLIDSNEKLSNYVNSKDKENYNNNKLLLEISKIKSSFDFKSALDIYLSEIEKNIVPKNNFSLLNYDLVKYDYIQNLFTKEYSRLCFKNRINEIKKHLRTSIKKFKAKVLEKIENECDRKVEAIKESVDFIDDNTRKKIRKLIEKKESQILKLEKESKTIVNSYFKSTKFLKPWEYYKEFLKRNDILKITFKDEKLLKNFIEKNSAFSDKKPIEIEDLAPMLYIKYRIFGIEEKIPVRHIVIDEAQDFSIFQFYILKNIIKDSSFTILGDICQGIYSYRGTSDWEKIKDNIFTNKCEIMELKQCYRTTVEIMDTANTVIKNLKDENFKLAQPVIRHGDEVKFIKTEKLSQTVSTISYSIKNSLKKDFKSIAIICKTIDECNLIYNELKTKVKDIYVLTGKEKEYKGGIAIIPVYLSKGLEFDIVFIFDASSSNYSVNENLEIKLLYVAITRAMHKLYIFYNNELTQLFS